MSIEVTEHTDLKEKSVQVFDTGNEDDNGFTNGLRIHPWHRYLNHPYEDHSVYVTTGWFGKDGEIHEDDEGIQSYQNVIVNREDFVEAILAVFPELKRAGAV